MGAIDICAQFVIDRKKRPVDKRITTNSSAIKFRRLSSNTQSSCHFKSFKISSKKLKRKKHTYVHYLYILRFVNLIHHDACYQKVWEFRPDYEYSSCNIPVL